MSYKLISVFYCFCTMRILPRRTGGIAAVEPRVSWGGCFGLGPLCGSWASLVVTAPTDSPSTSERICLETCSNMGSLLGPLLLMILGESIAVPIEPSAVDTYPIFPDDSPAACWSDTSTDSTTLTQRSTQGSPAPHRVRS